MRKHCCNYDELCENDIDNFDIDDLLNEINDRLPKHEGYSQLKLIATEDLNLIERTIANGDKCEAIWLLQRAIFPKWKDIKAAREAWKRATAPPPPPPRVGLWCHAI